MDGDNLVVRTLSNYKRLAENVDNHEDMLKEKTTLTFLAYVLDSADEETLKLSLTTLELLANNSKNREVMKNTFGVREALETLKEEKRESEISQKASDVLQLMSKKETPEKKTETGQNNNNNNKVRGSKKRKVITLQVHGLHLETRKELEDILTKMTKGVLSVMVDVEHQRCVVTVFDHVDPKELAKILADNSPMEAKLVTRNALNQEMLVPLIDRVEPLELDDLPPYLDEKDSPVKDKAVRSMKDIRITASEWFSSAAGFLQRSLYW